MSVGRSLNTLDVQVYKLDCILQEIELALEAKSSNADLQTKELTRRLERVINKARSFEAGLERAWSHEQSRQFGIKQSHGSRDYRTRDALDAHKKQFAELSDRLDRLMKRCERLAERAKAPTGSDILEWASSQLGVGHEAVTGTPAKHASGDLTIPQPQPGGGVLVAIAALVATIGKFKALVREYSDNS